MPTWVCNYLSGGNTHVSIKNAENEYEMRARRADADREAALDDERDEARARRMESFDRGFCSYRAAVRGGNEYEMEVRAALLEDDALAVENPVFAAVNGWLAGYAVMARANSRQEAA